MLIVMLSLLTSTHVSSWGMAFTLELVDALFPETEFPLSNLVRDCFSSSPFGVKCDADLDSLT